MLCAACDVMSMLVMVTSSGISCRLSNLVVIVWFKRLGEQLVGATGVLQTPSPSTGGPSARLHELRTSAHCILCRVDTQDEYEIPYSSTPRASFAKSRSTQAHGIQRRVHGREIGVLYRRRRTLAFEICVLGDDPSVLLEVRGRDLVHEAVLREAVHGCETDRGGENHEILPAVSKEEGRGVSRVGRRRPSRGNRSDCPTAARGIT